MAPRMTKVQAAILDEFTGYWREPYRVAASLKMLNRFRAGAFVQSFNSCIRRDWLTAQLRATSTGKLYEVYKTTPEGRSALRMCQ